MGRWGWVGRRRKLHHILKLRKSHCVFTQSQKQPQCTEMVVVRSLSPLVALLVPPSGMHVCPKLDRHKFTGLQNDASESKPVYLLLCQWCV